MNKRVLETLQIQLGKGSKLTGFCQETIYDSVK